MSQIVKILIVANLIFSVVLAVLTMQTYAWRENYKRRWDEDTKSLMTELKLSNQQLADLSMAKIRQEALVKSLNTRTQELQATLRAKEDDILLKDTEIGNLKTEKKKVEDQLAAMNENFLTQTGSLDQVRKRNSELTHIAQVARATAFNLNVKLAEVEDDLNNAQTELSTRTAETSKIRADLNQHKAMLASLQRSNPSIYRELVDEKASTKYLEGVVAAISGGDGQQDVVMLSIGTNTGVEEGIEFIIYRGSDYIAKVRTERVLNDMVACRIIPESWNTKNLAIQQGDTAVNRL